MTGRYIDRTVAALMAVNAFMFVALVATTSISGSSAADWLGMNWPWPWPWTPLTCIFTNSSAIDLVFNMLWLWCFSRLFLETGTPRRLLATYIVGGLCGCALFMAASAAGLCGGTLFGASAAILAIVCHAAATAPRLRIRLMFFGPVELRWIAAVAAGLSLLAFASGNAGGAFAHIGGALGGLACGRVSLKRRFNRRKLIKPDEATTLDGILDKVRRSGYSSLTPSERTRLFEISKKL